MSDYVRSGVNAPADFTNPDNLALDKNGNLFITEDTTNLVGMDIWMAVAGSGADGHLAAEQTVTLREPDGLHRRAERDLLRQERDRPVRACAAPHG